MEIVAWRDGETSVPARRHIFLLAARLSSFAAALCRRGQGFLGHPLLSLSSAALRFTVETSPLVLSPSLYRETYRKGRAARISRNRFRLLSLLLAVSVLLILSSG